ncbi:unnamed protein product [Parascedosporium putredinis]|uniref:Major facilitator superfamily (MFS) profile domain-containing protein n=1 Tax=Parascedosporium putredinis TaxID=1442378 RepID=A0A9P1H694_9PEZI|nr:unnamed protein product [Parascedosporium putredinis]CAI7997403.1 unnamed protein product [Parascedosporium putredinis]
MGSSMDQPLQPAGGKENDTLNSSLDVDDPQLCFLYLLAFLDRTNIGNAKIAGLSDSLGMSGPQYNLALTIFFVSYAVFEPLTNVLLKSWRPSRFIPVIVIFWGLSMLGMGFVTNWSGLMAARWFLGLTEAGLFPGINYYLSCWFLSEEERARVLRRLQDDGQRTADTEQYKSAYLWAALRDWKTWLSMVIYMGCDMPLYAFSLFLPSIIKSLGWNTSVVRAQLLSAAPYVAAAGLTVGVGYIADRTRKRGLCNLAASALGIVGFAMLLGSGDPAVKYAATF